MLGVTEPAQVGQICLFAIDKLSLHLRKLIKSDKPEDKEIAKYLFRTLVDFHKIYIEDVPTSGEKGELLYIKTILDFYKKVKSPDMLIYLNQQMFQASKKNIYCTILELEVYASAETLSNETMKLLEQQSNDLHNQKLKLRLTVNETVMDPIDELDEQVFWLAKTKIIKEMVR